MGSRLIFNKIRRLATAFWHETIKRVPYILLVLAVLLLWQNYQNGRKATKTLDKLDVQSLQLSRQGDTITQQNKDIKSLQEALNSKTDTINKHVDCIVALFLPNKLPPTAADIDGCRATTQITSPSPSAQTKTGSQNPVQSNTNNNTSNNNKQSDNTQGGGGGTSPKFVDTQINRLQGIGRALGGVLGL